MKRILGGLCPPLGGPIEFPFGDAMQGARYRPGNRPLGAGKTRANDALIYLSATTTFSVFNNCIGFVDFIVDVNGYFE